MGKAPIGGGGSSAMRLFKAIREQDGNIQRRWTLGRALPAVTRALQ